MKFNLLFSRFVIFSLLSIVIMITSCGKGGTSVEEAYKLIPVRLKKEGKISLMNLDGKVVLEDEFSAESQIFYSEGIVMEVNKDRKVKYYKISGNKSALINDAKYMDGTPFINGYALVKKDNGMLCLIDDEGKEKIQNLSKIENYNVVRAGVVSDNLIRFKTDEGLWGYVDLDGKVAIKPSYKACENFNDGKARVKNSDGLVQIIDKSGEIKFKGKDNYNYLPLTDGLIGFKENSSEKDYYGFMNIEGEKVIKDNKYMRCSSFKSGMAVVRGEENDSWGVIDEKGEVIGDLKTKFEEEPIISYSGNVFINNRKDKKCKVYNSKGELKKEIEDYQFVFPLTAERYLAVLKSEKLAVINNEGKEISNDEFYFADYRNFFFRAFSDNIEFKNSLSLASSYFDFEPLFKDIFKEVSLNGMLGVSASSSPSQVFNTWPYNTPSAMSGSSSKRIYRGDDYEKEMSSNSKASDVDVAAPSPYESDPYSDAPAAAVDSAKVEEPAPGYGSSINDPYSFISTYTTTYYPQNRYSGGLSYSLSFGFDSYIKQAINVINDYGYPITTGYQLNNSAKLNSITCSFNFDDVDSESFFNQLKSKIMAAGWQKNGEDYFTNNNNGNQIRFTSYSVTMSFPSAIYDAPAEVAPVAY